MLVNYQVTKISNVANMLPFLLKGQAFEWWKLQNKNLVDWTSFKKELIQKFPPPLEQANEDLIRQQRKQGVDEPILDYYYAMMHLCDKYDVNMSSKDKANKLIDGLKMTLYEQVIEENIRMILTPAELLTRLQQMEYAQIAIDTRRNQLQYDGSINDMVAPMPFHSSRRQNNNNASSYSKFLFVTTDI
ncbi:unnamed protein product [Didymodactylos carnosus]|uniref:Retrotransposon gag domain-containing protein n=1 Tax=Didymodactylos carnosus TaxID=1234261 RepID=A0A8S2YP08_9BILA|nr:unnamed protein product [Didymodactylos carnosus]